MNKSVLRSAFIVGTILFSLAFLALSLDSLAQVPARTNEGNLTPQVAAGKRAWQAHDCIGCHTILGIGAYYAPDLTKVTVRRTPEFVAGWLKNPGGQMPNQHLTDQEVADLVAFLQWVAEIDTNNWPPAPIGVEVGAAKPPVPTAAVPVLEKIGATGAALFRSKGCTACHGSSGQGTSSAPSLKGITSKYDADFLTRWLRNPSAVKPGTAMPTLRLKDDEIAALIEFLKTIR
jgi:nitric oxide reductase subunit C